MQLSYQIWDLFLLTFTQDRNLFLYIFALAPLVLFFELPLYFIIWMGVFRRISKDEFEIPFLPAYLPRVTCIITCYSEGETIKNTVISLLEQIYPGHIEIIAVVDGVSMNQATYHALKTLTPLITTHSRRSFIIIPKIQRGGRVSSTNAGLMRASGTIILAADGDTSFDNQTIYRATLHFENPDVIAVTGPMRVRNSKASIVTRLQNLEYMLTMQVGKFGLADFNVINIVPGAFGIFRKSFLRQIGGWNTGSGEDLDLTLRMKQYLKRHPQLKTEFEPRAVSHTDVPVSLKDFLKQRLRWEGDLWYIYSNKHNQGISPSLMGWRNFIFILWYGILFQVVMPFTIVLYMIHMSITQHLQSFLVIMMLIYFFYLLLTLVQTFLYLLVISDRKWNDCEVLLMLPIFPLFQFIARIWSAIALTNQMLNKAHLDSAMAPWWVLKKGK